MEEDTDSNKSAIAKARWKLLSQVLRKKEDRNKLPAVEQKGSVRNFLGFDIFQRESYGDNTKVTSALESWKKYNLKSVEDSKEVYVRFLENVTSAKDLIGFNNTGNVCIWPSEEVLAYYCWRHHSKTISNKHVIELGCGMSGLAGLYLAKNLDVKEMVLTDGNERSIENLNIIISRNEIANVSCRLLKWMAWFDEEDNDLHESFDVVICGDCLFFVELHDILLSTIQFLMKREGICILTAPRRSGSLDKFVEFAKQLFSVTVKENYDDFIWSQHQYHQQNTPSYNPNLHYPVVVILEIPRKFDFLKSVEK